MPLVSIVVPAYNVEPFLPSCVESVLAQTMPDWELLLVDDGSSDGTGEIIREYEKRDKRVHGIFQTNAGAAAARNRALDAATGEYVAFLDSDDRYKPAMLESLLDAEERENADVAACGAEVFPENGGETELLPIREQILLGPEAVTEYFLRGEQGLYCVWNKLFRRSLIGDIRFSPYTRGEDALFNAKVLQKCGKYVGIGPCLYDYRKREGSVTSERFTPRRLDVVKAWEEIFYLTDGSFPALSIMPAAKTVHEADRLFLMGSGSGHPSWRDIRRELIEVHNTLYLRQFARPIPGKKRLADAVFRISPELYFRISGGK